MHFAGDSQGVTASLVNRHKSIETAAPRSCCADRVILQCFLLYAHISGVAFFLIHTFVYHRTKKSGGGFGRVPTVAFTVVTGTHYDHTERCEQSLGLR